LIEFNPNIVSYEDLVIEWTRMHTPVGKSKCQYRSAVWYLNEEQKEICDAIVDGMRATYGKDMCSSSVEIATKFYKAEEYHQNFHANMTNGGGRF
jgi:peptide-methionine (S)-S-oxide reductase